MLYSNRVVYKGLNFKSEAGLSSEDTGVSRCSCHFRAFISAGKGKPGPPLRGSGIFEEKFPRLVEASVCLSTEKEEGHCRAKEGV